MEEVNAKPSHSYIGVTQTLENYFNQMSMLTDAILRTLFLKLVESQMVFIYQSLLITAKTYSIIV